MFCFGVDMWIYQRISIYLHIQKTQGNINIHLELHLVNLSLIFTLSFLALFLVSSNSWGKCLFSCSTFWLCLLIGAEQAEHSGLIVPCFNLLNSCRRHAGRERQQNNKAAGRSGWKTPKRFAELDLWLQATPLTCYYVKPWLIREASTIQI